MILWVFNSSTDPWDWNPATVEALGAAGAGLFASIAVVVAWLSWRQSKKQTKALEDEISARLRPWVGLYDFEYRRNEADQPVLHVLLRNLGTLPAQDADLKIVVRPVQWMDGETPNPAVSQKPEAKALMPSEDGDYTIGLARYPQVDLWIATERDVVVEGTFTYSLEKRSFQSTFVGELWFSRPKPKPAKAWWKFFKQPTNDTKLVPTTWRNVSAT